MKGLVFTEFLEMVENKFSPELADKIIDASQLSTDGAYTSVGTYHHGELVQLVSHLSEETDIGIQPLIKAFGQYLFGSFVKNYPLFFKENSSTFGFLQLIEDHVHVEVRKLYPEAELPNFETKLLDENRLEMIYQSKRPFASLAEGLMEGCIEHHNEDIHIDITDLSDGENKHVRYVLTRHDRP